MSVRTKALKRASPRCRPNAPTVVTEGASNVTQSTATLNARVNPEGSEVTSCEFEYGTTQKALASKQPCASNPGGGTAPVAVTAKVTGLEANKTYYFRISARNGSGLTGTGTEASFGTPPNVPTVVTESASGETQTTATLNATVNPEGVETLECKFEWGTTESYGDTPVPCHPKPGSQAVAISSPLTGLTPGTTYHFRISARNASGSSVGQDMTFPTLPNPPTVETRPASSVALNAATLNAIVDPNGGELGECRLEYGTTIAYGSSAPCEPSSDTGVSPVAVSAAVTGLAPNTTYHFRVFATNAGGTSPGADVTFTTQGPPTLPIVELGSTPGSTPGQPWGSGKLPRPVLGLVANVTLVTGRVQLRLPRAAGFVALSAARQIPFGTVVEADHARGWRHRGHSRGACGCGPLLRRRVHVDAGSDGSVLATLEGRRLLGLLVSLTRRPCLHSRGRRASRAQAVRPKRAETSRRGAVTRGDRPGGQWLTEDLCEGTLVLATRDRVHVADLVHRRQVEVVAGHIDLVKPH